MTRPLKNNHGSAVIAALVIAALLLAGLVVRSQWQAVRSQSSVQVNGSKRAMSYAESGISHAVNWLRMPSLQDELPVNSSTTLVGQQPDGRYAVAVYRRNADPNLVDLQSTGYFHLPRGSEDDNGKPAQIAVVAARVRLSNVGEYLAATNASLTIGYGTDIQSGSVYAQDLSFQSGATLPKTRVARAYFLNSVNGTTTDVAPSWVEFTANPPFAQRLAYAPALSTLDPSVRALYLSRASTDPLPSLQGSIPPPSDTHVYLATHDVDIGVPGANTSYSGVFVLYSTGHVRIHGSVRPADANSWMAIISEKDIRFDADAPAVVTVEANLIANRAVTADPPAVPRTNGSLTIIGGMVAQTGLNLAGAWPESIGATRTYSFRQFNDPLLYLPNFATIVEYRIVRGKYIR
jgi:hypothetical protein